MHLCTLYRRWYILATLITRPFFVIKNSKISVESMYLCIMEWFLPPAYPDEDILEWIILGADISKSLQKYFYF